MLDFLYVKDNSKQICEEILFLYFFQKNADTWLPLFFFVNSNSPCKALLFPRGPNLVQKPLYLVGTVLKTRNIGNFNVAVVTGSM